MRLAAITYSHRAVWPYLCNLLPENPTILQRWGQQFHVSSASPFKLLKFVGADVARGIVSTTDHAEWPVGQWER
jgi:HipA-like protein